jgi:hypothetical protein
LYYSPFISHEDVYTTYTIYLFSISLAVDYKLKPNKIAAVKIDRSYESPEKLLGANASWAMSFTEAAIIKALNEA